MFKLLRSPPGCRVTELLWPASRLFSVTGDFPLETVPIGIRAYLQFHDFILADKHSEAVFVKYLN
jgi:hypothetical protein